MCVNYCPKGFLSSCQRVHSYIVSLCVWTSVAIFLGGFLAYLLLHAKIFLKFGIKAISQMVFVTRPQSFSQGRPLLTSDECEAVTQEGRTRPAARIGVAL